MKHRRGVRAALVVAASSMLLSWSGQLAAQQQHPAKDESTDKPVAASEPADESTPGSRRTSAGAAQADAAQSPDRQPTGGFKGWVEKGVRTFTSASGERERHVTVSVGTVTPGSGLAGGVGYKSLDAFKPGIGFEAGAMLSARLYQQYSLAIGVLTARASTVELDTADTRVGSLFNDSERKAPGSALFVDVRYRDYPQHMYYGEGIESRRSDRADYSLSGVSVEGVWQRQFTSSIGLSVRGGVLDLRVGRGTNDSLVNFEERFLPETIQGALTQPRFVTLGAGLVRDTRRNPAAPEHGTMVGLALRRFANGGTTDLDFTRLTLDARAYAMPKTTRGVLAMRALVSSDFTDNGRPTPFYLQQSLGGGDSIRGLPPYRFQDQALYVFSAEYRWRVHRYVEVAPFVDAGNTASALSGLTFRSLKVGPGLAVRARTDKATFLRLEMGTSSEGYRIMVGTGPAF
jgi:hypothetical protein